MDKVYVKGQKLFITTEAGTYDGTFHSMDKGRNRLTVNDVVKHPSLDSCDGLIHFYRSEILDVQIMDPLSSAWLTPGTEIVTKKKMRIMKGVQAPPTHRIPLPRRGALELPTEIYKYYQNLLKRVITIDDVDEDFDQAMADIMSQTIVGVSSEGTLLGRKGNLSWISVCCEDLSETEKESAGLTPVPSHVKLYLFDVALMGTMAFTKGLKNFFENKHSPKKVIHDCRFLSNCLYHQFDVNLKNVLDTQVAESVMSFPKVRKEENNVPNLVFTRSLSSCLAHSFGLPANLLYHPNINDGYLQKYIEIWYQRPITALMVKAIAFQSIYLIHLWNKLSQAESYEAFKSGIKIYLSCVRDADDDSEFLMTNCFHLMPEAFIPILMQHHRNLKYTKTHKGGNARGVRQVTTKK